MLTHAAEDGKSPSPEDEGAADERAARKQQRGRQGGRATSTCASRYDASRRVLPRLRRAVTGTGGFAGSEAAVWGGHGKPFPSMMSPVRVNFFTSFRLGSSNRMSSMTCSR